MTSLTLCHISTQHSLGNKEFTLKLKQYACIFNQITKSFTLFSKENIMPYHIN